MKKYFIAALTNCMFIIFSLSLSAQNMGRPETIPVNYEELNASEFSTALKLADSVCVIPMGILEKHGPHLPLGTDLLDARETALRAANEEYFVVFPQYYFGQIYEAKHQPGAIAYSPELVWNLLEETCDELARNGFKKIVLVNGHGGNRFFLHYFAQAQLREEKDYAMVLFTPEADSSVEKRILELRKTKIDGHAGETETSMIKSHRPDLAKTELGKEESGENLNRLKNLPYAFTGIWWYARYPNHYAGDGSEADKQIGNLIFNHRAAQLAKLVKVLKNDNSVIQLQNEFFKKSKP